MALLEVLRRWKASLKIFNRSQLSRLMMTIRQRIGRLLGKLRCSETAVARAAVCLAKQRIEPLTRPQQ